MGLYHRYHHSKLNLHKPPKTDPILLNGSGNKAILLNGRKTEAILLNGRRNEALLLNGSKTEAIV